MQLIATRNRVGMPFCLGLAHSQSPHSCTQPPALPPSPTAIDSKESIAKDLKCSFSEMNNAWIVSLMRDPSGCFEPLKPSTYLYVFSVFIRAAWSWHPHVKLLCSWHHSVTFSTLALFRNYLLPLTSPVEENNT